MKTMIGAGEEHDGVYYFKDVQVARVNKTDGNLDQDLWHRRLGHPAFSVLSSLPMCSGVLNKASSSQCDVCFRAKQTRYSFSESLNKTEVCFGLIHVDVWGPYRVPSSNGSVYFLTILDDYSRALWTYLLLAKSEVKTVLRNFCAYAEKQFNKSVKIVRSDNGTEFTCLRSYFGEKGIIYQTSCVATPQQNGRVERKHRHILNVARALLIQAKLLIKFWGETISTATHLINLTPTPLLKGLSPHEVLFEQKPSYQHLRVFGSSCYVHRRARDKDKFGERSRHCIFFGYPFGKKGWRVYDLDRNEFLVSCDVVFQENVFPLAKQDSVQKTITGNVETCDGDWLLDSEKIDENRGSLEPTVDPVPSNRIEPAVECRGNVAADQTTVSLVSDTIAEKIPEAPAESETSVPEEQNNQQAEQSNKTTSSTTEELGRGHREKFVPAKLRDYKLYNARCDPHHTLIAPPSESTTVPGNSTPYPIENLITDAHFSAEHQAFLAAVTAGVEPKSFKEAVKYEIWRNSMKKEIHAFEVNKTFSIVDATREDCNWKYVAL